MNPIILPGQVYLHATHNEYVVVTQARRGDVTFEAKGLKGHLDVELFLSLCQPVDPADLTPIETALLIELLGEASLKVGYITEAA